MQQSPLHDRHGADLTDGTDALLAGDRDDSIGERRCRELRALVRHEMGRGAVPFHRAQEHLGDGGGGRLRERDLEGEGHAAEDVVRISFNTTIRNGAGISVMSIMTTWFG